MMKSNAKETRVAETSMKANSIQLLKVGKENNEESKTHVYLKNRFVCDTDPRGHATPSGRSMAELVVNASEGFIPLWNKGTALQWRFQERSMTSLASPKTVKSEIRKLMGEALLAWDSAVPIKLVENDDTWDFEIVVRTADNCRPEGCVLASAFFPDAGRHEFVVYPKMFSQSRKEQVDTFIHEFGHVFGLRHFFANLEIGHKSEIYGTHHKFTIMNYGSDSELTEEDKKDLKSLYRLVWEGKLSEINGTPIRLVSPYHTGGVALDQRDLTISSSRLDKNVESAQKLLRTAADLLAGKQHID